MPPLMSELRRIARRLARAPLFTAVTLITLALGIGANTAIFSVINGVLLRPLPFPDPDRLVGVWHTAPGLGIKVLNASPSTYFTYREENHVFEDIGNYRSSSVTVTGLAEPQQARVLEVTQSVLPLLRAQPVLGRSFTSDEDSPNGPKAVILTYAYWQQRFGGAPNALGQKLLLDAEPYQIVGVMPKSFRFLDADPALLLPMRYDRAKVFVGNFSFDSVARLKPGVTLQQANADVERMLPLMTNKFPAPPGFNMAMFRDARIGPNLHPFKDDAVGDVGKVLWILMATVGIVLLIACANAANLFLVRAEGRQRELAVRAALGASWSRLAGELLAESLLLGVVGGALGLLAAYGCIQLLVTLEPSSLPRLGEIALDGPVVAYAAGVSVLAGLVFGFVAVLKYARGTFGTALKEGGRGGSDSRERNRARGFLVASQVAMALVLLIGSVLMMRSFVEIRRVSPGFVDPAHVLTMRISIPDAEIKDDEKAVRTHEAIIRKLEQIPGVTSVAAGASLTMDGYDSHDPSFVEDHPIPDGQMPPMRNYKWMGPGMFKTLGNPLVAGRDFTWNDLYTRAPVIMISENLAREYWKTPGAALGKRIRERPNGTWREVIGVVANEHDAGADRPAPTIMYWPILIKDFWQFKDFAQRSLAYAVRSPRVGTEAFGNEVRNAVWSVNGNLPIARMRTLERIYERSMARTSFTLVMLAIASGMALLLSLVGIYGVIAYSVSRRTREIGIRMALGAAQADVRGLFVRRGLAMTGAGVVVGLAAAAGLTRAMQALLFGVGPLDPLTYIAAPLTLLIAAMAASYVPARRATSVDPARALRSE
ncbi:MAG: ABC transporter permease [Acidobacteria bacterium]|nr:ABC transporter permease [Acidobacteriota bacterium]